MKYKAHLSVFTSKRDMYGNRYGYLMITNNLTGKVGQALLDSIGNEDFVLRELGFDYKNMTKTHVELPIREFDRQAKGLPYDYIKVLCEVLGKSYSAYKKRKEKEEQARNKAIEDYRKLRAKVEKEKDEQGSYQIPNVGEMSVTDN